MSPLLKWHTTTTKLATVLTLAHFSKLSLLFSVLLPLLVHQTLTADDFEIVFTNKTRAISDQFIAPQTDDKSQTTNTPLSTPSLLSRRRKFPKLILSNHPTTCPRDPIPLTSFRPFLLQSYLRVLTLSIPLFTLVHFPQHLSRLG